MKIKITIQKPAVRKFKRDLLLYCSHNLICDEKLSNIHFQFCHNLNKPVVSSLFIKIQLNLIVIYEPVKLFLSLLLLQSRIHV